MSIAERENVRMNGVRRTVLVVDDEPINRSLLGHILGCDIVQGYYFSKPVPAGDFEKFITSEKE